MRYSVGVHPLDIEHWSDDTAAVLRRAALEDDRVVAIGELGLDLFRVKNLDEQLNVLRPQLDLAVELVAHALVPRLAEADSFTHQGVQVPLLRLHGHDAASAAAIVRALALLPMAGFSPEGIYR